MAKRSDRTPADSVRSKARAKSIDLDFILFEAGGEDPRPMIELPEGADVGQLANAHTDAIATVYDLDGEGDHVAVLLIVMKGPTAAAAAAAMIADAGEVARELLHDAATSEDA